MKHADRSLAPPRLWEVDAWRGFAIVLMVFYHFVWDLNFFGLYQGNILGTGWQSFARFIAVNFIFVLGLSLTLSYNSYRRKRGRPPSFAKYLRRGGLVFGWGLVISGTTYFFIGRGFVIFGILHLLGVSIVLGYPFLKLNRWMALLAGLVCIGLGIYLDTLLVSYPWLLWLGVKQSGVYMVDYYPLLPWFGVALLGLFAGSTLYPEGRPRFSLPDLSQTGLGRGLRFLGRHSLLIYLTHQPLLIGLLFLVTGLGSLD